MGGKVVLITGATDGIGLQTAKVLADGGAHVLIHGRNPRKVKKVVEDLRGRGRQAEGLVADLSSFRQVRALAEEVQRKVSRLDVLLNNAGVYVHQRQLTEDGHEMTLQVNHLSHFLLTRLLLPLLEASAPSRIINVSSIAHRRGSLDFDDPDRAHGFDGYGAYAQSKLANILFTRELAARLADKGVTVNALHPGVIGTKLLREGFGAGGASVEEGARTSVFLATSPEVEGVSGEYFVSCQKATPAPAAVDPEAQARLWALSERMTGVSTPR